MNVGNRSGQIFLACSAIVMLLMFLLAACDQPERLRSNAELGLNEQQARGRAIYDLRCAACHEPYRKKDLNGPTMSGVFKKSYLPSGMVARDDRVSDIILCGDFNALSWFPSLRRLSRRLADAQTGLDGHRPRRTWFGRFPIGRIDHVLVDPHWTVVHVEVPDDTLARVASDHRPVLVDIAPPVPAPTGPDDWPPSH